MVVAVRRDDDDDSGGITTKSEPILFWQPKKRADGRKKNTTPMMRAVTTRIPPSEPSDGGGSDDEFVMFAAHGAVCRLRSQGLHGQAAALQQRLSAWIRSGCVRPFEVWEEAGSTPPIRCGAGPRGPD